MDRQHYYTLWREGWKCDFSPFNDYTLRTNRE
jgi:hypothetical protein